VGLFDSSFRCLGEKRLARARVSSVLARGGVEERLSGVIHRRCTFPLGDHTGSHGCACILRECQQVLRRGAIRGVTLLCAAECVRDVR
jgi:hypothetical protein